MEKIIVCCPKCEKKYGLPKDAVSAGSPVKLKCGSCSVSFTFTPEHLPGNPPLSNPDATIFSQSFSTRDRTAPYHFPEDCQISISFTEKNRETRYRLTTRLTIVGRTEGKININDPLMSRKHFSIEVKSSAVIELKDLASKNGTFHNGMKVSSVLLQSGDMIQAGSTEITFSNRINI